MRKDLRVLATVLLIYSKLLLETSGQQFVREPYGVPCRFHNTVNITDGVRDHDDSILHNGLKYQSHLYAEYNYIIVNTTSKRTVDRHIRGCLCLLDKPCIRLCLPPVFEGFAEQIYVNKSNADSEYDVTQIENENYSLIYGKTCEIMFEMEPEEVEEDQWIFLTNGSVKLATGKLAQQHQYCMTTTFDNQTNNDKKQAILHLCFIEQAQLTAAFPVGMLISVPFLLVTLIVYSLIPELRNLHGKCLMCYVFGLTILYIWLSLIQLEKVHYRICTFAGYIVYISTLWCFAWLNVMCFDIWSVFRGVRGSHGNVERKKFILYCIYSFGLPTVLTSLVSILDSIDSLNVNYKPGMGFERCWLRNDRNMELIYVYLPISIILCINVTLYTITACKIFQVQKETSVVRKGESQKHSKNDVDRERFFLYLRLFIVMGVTWVMESISFGFKEFSIIFFLTDILNCLQGLIIFFLFLWKPKVKTLIIKRYRVARKLPPRMSMMGSTRTDTSRISTMQTAETKLLKETCSVTSA